MEKIIITLVLCFFACPVVAGDEQVQSEIDHLMNYIQNSNCKFIRNGEAYRSEKALKHILKKYDHFKAQIKTAEEFIDLCATKSILSNQLYKIECPDQEWVESKYWLLEELKRFRNN